MKHNKTNSMQHRMIQNIRYFGVNRKLNLIDHKENDNETYDFWLTIKQLKQRRHQQNVT